MAHPITLHSPLIPDAIATKLKDLLHDVPKTGRVTGNGSQETMRLFFYRPNFQNSFRCELNATMTADGAGASIAGRIGTPRSASIFMIVWFAFLSLFLVVAGGGTLAVGAPGAVSLTIVLVPAGMIAFGALLWWLGTRNAARDEAAILAFLADTLQARPVAVDAR